MMGMRMPETCWAVSKRQVINLKSCCIWLVDSVENTFKVFCYPLHPSYSFIFLEFFLSSFVSYYLNLILSCFFFHYSLPISFFVVHFLYSLLFPVFRSSLLLLSPLLSIPHFPSLLSFLPCLSCYCFNARYRRHPIPSFVIQLGTCSNHHFAPANSWPRLPNTAVPYAHST